MAIKFNLDDLSSLKREELYQLAQELEIKGRSKLTKAELVEALAPFAQKQPDKKVASTAKDTAARKTPADKTPAAKEKRAKESPKATKTSKVVTKQSKKDEVKTSPVKATAESNPAQKPKKTEPRKKQPAKSEKTVKAPKEKNGAGKDEAIAANQESILSRSFAKQKSEVDQRKKKGAIVQSVAIPVELVTSIKPEEQSPKARQIEEERSKRHASLKTTMEIPVFGAPAPEAALPIAEEDLTGDLPADYGETRIVVQVRDPHWAHAYWQIPRAELKRLEMDVGIFEYAHSHFVLKVHNVTDGFTQEFSLSEHARSHYFYLENANTVYQAELGLHSPTEGYTFIALSNLIQTPPDQVSSFWAAPVKLAKASDEDRIAGHAVPSVPARNEGLPSSGSDPIPEITEPEKVYQASVSRQNDLPASLQTMGDSGRPDLPQPLMHEAPEQVDVLPAPISSWMSGSPAVGSFSSPAAEPLRLASAEETDIFLNTVPELILYGRVDSRCSLDFNGRKVYVEPDGSYSLRFLLPVNQDKALELEAREPKSGKTRTIRATVKFEIL